MSIYALNRLYVIQTQIIPTTAIHPFQDSLLVARPIPIITNSSWKSYFICGYLSLLRAYKRPVSGAFGQTSPTGRMACGRGRAYKRPVSGAFGQTSCGLNSPSANFGSFWPYVVFFIIGSLTFAHHSYFARKRVIDEAGNVIVMRPRCNVKPGNVVILLRSDPL